MELWLRPRGGEPGVSGDDEVRAWIRRIGPGRYRVELGEDVWEVDAAAVGDGLSSLRLASASAGGSGHGGSGGGSSAERGGSRPHHEVSTVPDGAGGYRVATRHHTSEVEVMTPLEHLSRHALGEAGARGPERVTAYMPGRVVAVLVDEGAEVEAGRGVVVLEAMKMENEIQAEHAGTVRRLLVEPGQSVEAGEGLFELE